jgi:uncharacterized membrane protein
MIKFIKYTIAGGVFLLLPVVVFILVLAKVFYFLRGIIHNSPLAEFAGPLARSVIAVFFILFLCFLGGLLMRTGRVRNFIKWLEDRILIYLPGYAFVKTLSSNQLQKGSGSDWKPASVFIDDNEVICFVIDESEHYCTLFLPSAPAPSSGTVCVREKEKVKYLDMNMTQAMLLIKQFGRGAAKEIEKLGLHESMK